MCKLGVEEKRLTNEDLARQHFEHDFEGCARDSRRDFAYTLESISLSPSLKHVQLSFSNYLDGCGSEQCGGGPNFLIPPIKHNMFSNNLCLSTSNLRSLDLHRIADETLFWSSHGNVSWPNLEYLNVMFQPTTPSGT